MLVHGVLVSKLFIIVMLQQIFRNDMYLMFWTQTLVQCFGIGNGLGYGAILIIIAFFRELFGSGSIFGFKVFAATGLPFQGNGLMLLPAGACIIVGLIIWAQRAYNKHYEE